MARYTESSCRICRRENLKMYLKGDRCYTDKCAIERRPYPPGQHGQGRVKFSGYGVQLREKQKVKRMYGLLESQFRGYYHRASAAKGKTGENLLQQLEPRDHGAVAPEQRHQQVELHRRQRDRAAVADDGAAIGVHLHVAEPVQARRRRPRAPQERLDARQQLEDAERLRHVVIGAEPQAAHLVGFLGPGGEQQHRHVRSRGAPHL